MSVGDGFVGNAPRRALLLALCAGWVWIAWASAAYFLPGPLHPFVVEKLPASASPGWRFALQAHVASALFTLPSFVLLTSERLRRRALAAHRVLGKVAATVVLLVLVPSGLILARTATGGLASAAGFALSGVILSFAVVRAVIAARAHRVAEHRRFMHHALGQMGVAVLSRALLVVAGFVELDPLVAYLASLWGPVLGVAWAVEWLHRPVVRPPIHAGVAAMPAFARRLVILLALPAALSASSRAASPGPGGVVEQLDRALLQPLAAREAEQSRFSRAARPPRERRVRLTADAAAVDARGGRFYAFAVDERWASSLSTEWRPDAIVGCIYPATGKVFVQREGVWMAAAWLLGEEADTPSDGVCQAVGAT